MAWRRGFSTRPPPVTSFSQFYPGNDERYVWEHSSSTTSTAFCNSHSLCFMNRRYLTDVRWSITETTIRSFERRRLVFHRKLPKTESLKDCMDRTIPYFRDNIVPNSINQGKRVLIASSENAIRGLLMHLCDIPEDRISEVEIPTGLPLIYDVKNKCIRLLDDGTGEDPTVRYKFSTAQDLLFERRSVSLDTPKWILLQLLPPHSNVDHYFLNKFAKLKKLCFCNIEATRIIWQQAKLKRKSRLPNIIESFIYRCE